MFLMVVLLSFFVPVVECGEPLIDVKEERVIGYREDLVAKYPHCTKVRQTVYEMLCRAQKLLPDGIRFRLTVGFRSLERQQELFEEMHRKVVERSPKLDEEQIFRETSKFVAPLRTWEGEKNIPAHSTGGAIDIILVDLDGNRLEMGNDLEGKYQADLICTDSILISSEARKNRDIMSFALSSVGFVNYPTEFWHWSYGDSLWAEKTQAAYAIYNSVDIK